MTTHYRMLVAIIEADSWPDDVDECVEWEHHKLPAGYGKVWVDGKTLYVHRLAYCLSEGKTLDDIEDKVIRHSCNNPSCFRPDHLDEGSQKDNMRDRDEQGRNYRTNITHCPAGHEYTTENTRLDKNGGRYCRECGRRSCAEQWINRTQDWKDERKVVRNARNVNRTPEQKAAAVASQRAYRAKRTPEKKAEQNAARRANYAKHKAAASNPST